MHSLGLRSRHLIISLSAALLGLVMVTVTTGCSSSGAEGDGKDFNDADVTFATEMMQHHAQALQMVDLTLGRDLDPEVASLAEEIRAAQTPEIEKMVDWLEDWDKPIPETVRDHANAHGDGSASTELPGMMSHEEIEGLEAAKGEQFQQMWLEMMIEHHQGAVDMAEAEQESGEFSAAVAMAEDIESSQTQEIETMRGLLG